MRAEYQTQMICVSETNGSLFECKMNEALKTLVNPDIRMDQTRPFTAYIFYQIQHDIPETVTEALEILEGKRYYCMDCPACEISEDKRRKKQFCQVHKKMIHQNTPACIDFYKLRKNAAILTNNDLITK